MKDKGKYMANPFLEEFIEKNKSAFVMHQKKYVEERHFIKIYVESNSILASLASSSKLLFEYIFREMQETGSYNRTELDVSFKHYQRFCKRRSIKSVAEKTFYRARSELVEKKVIAASEVNGIFYINLNFFFNGDRFMVATEYIRKSGGQSPAAQVQEVKEVREEVAQTPEVVPVKKRQAFVL